jgi:hypothetical protein
VGRSPIATTGVAVFCVSCFDHHRAAIDQPVPGEAAPERLERFVVGLWRGETQEGDDGKGGLCRRGPPRGLRHGSQKDEHGAAFHGNDAIKVFIGWPPALPRAG